MDQSTEKTVQTRLSGRSPRDLGVSIKFTDAEYLEVVEASATSGKARGEWARDTLLSAARGKASSAILPEIKGMQVLLLNGLQSLLCGQKLMTPEQFHHLVEQARAAKNDAAKGVA